LADDEEREKHSADFPPREQFTFLFVLLSRVFCSFEPELAGFFCIERNALREEAERGVEMASEYRIRAGYGR